VPLSFIGDVWRVMARCPQHTFQVLTKRPQRAARQISWEHERANMYGTGNSFVVGSPDDGYKPLPNVWLGTTIESDRYSFRANWLRETPAAVRWLSLEPLIGPLPSLSFEGIDWVVIGGESGHGARPMELEWAADLVDRAQAAGVAVHVKQLGTVLGKQLGVGHHDFDEFPVELRVRETVA
jgi:protein gp37